MENEGENERVNEEDRRHMGCNLGKTNSNREEASITVTYNSKIPC